MNTIQMTDTDYLRSNRTIETLRLSNTDTSNTDTSKTFFVFNYEGVHFRVLESEKDARKTAAGDTDIKVIAEFTKEDELDEFLEKVVL